VILSSHILAEVEATCDRILIISKGRIVANGTARDLRKQAQGREVIRVAVEGAVHDRILNALQRLDSVALVEPVTGRDELFEIQSREGMSSRRNIFSMCVANNWYLTELSPVETRLEDVFRELTMN